MFRKIALLFVFIGPCIAQQPVVWLHGILVGDDGTPIAGGFITIRYQRTVPPGRSMPPLAGPTEYTMKSAVDGAFRFDGLRRGNYLLCAQVPRSHWLNSCDWDSKPMTISAFTPPPEAVKVVLRRGALVPIRVDDPGLLLSQNEGKTPGAHLLVGVGGNEALFRPALLLSGDAGGRNYQNLIPFDFPVKVVLSSSFFQLADQLGTPVPATTVFPVTAVRGQVPPAVRLIVTGTRNP